MVDTRAQQKAPDHLRPWALNFEIAPHFRAQDLQHGGSPSNVLGVFASLADVSVRDWLTLSIGSPFGGE
jgi:hypothetical protein